MQTGGIDQQRNHHHIAGYLQAAVPARLRDPAQQDKVKYSESDPEDEERKEKTIGAKATDVLRPNNADRQDEGDRQETNTRQPV